MAVLGMGALAVNNFGDTRGDGLVAPIGLLIIVLLATATVFLIRNMNSRLRRLPDRFPNGTSAPASPGPAVTGGPAGEPAPSRGEGATPGNGTPH